MMALTLNGDEFYRYLEEHSEDLKSGALKPWVNIYLVNDRGEKKFSSSGQIIGPAHARKRQDGTLVPFVNFFGRESETDEEGRFAVDPDFVVELFEEIPSDVPRELYEL